MRVDLEDLPAGLDVRQRDLDDPVEATRAEEGLVQDVGPVRRTDDLHLAERVEAVELREELHQGALDLAVPARRDLEPLRADGVKFVDEHDARALLPGHLEQFPHEAGALPDVLLDELGADESDEPGVRAVRDRLREEGLPGARGAHEEHALRRLDPHLPIQVGFQERVFHGLLDLADLVPEAADVPVREGGLVDDLRAHHDRVQRWREDAHHGEGLLVQGDPRPDDDVLLRDVLRGVHDEVGSGGTLHDDAAVREDVPDAPDDQGGRLQPVELRLQPLDLLLEAEELRLDEPLLPLDPLRVLEELVVAVLEDGDALGEFLVKFTDLVVVH